MKKKNQKTGYELNLRYDFSSLKPIKEEETEVELEDIGITFDAENSEDVVKDLLKTAKIKYQPVAFENAAEMAKAIDLEADYFAMVPGSFVFGDLLEALCLKKALQPKRLFITTLGMSPDNVDSLVNMHDFLYCKEINLIVSHYYASVERNKNIPYIIEQFGGRNMNLAVCGNHSKVVLMERENGSDFVIFGSANLSSSANLEVFAIIHDREVVKYVRKLMTGIMKKWTVVKGLTRETIFENNADNRTTALWQQVKHFVRMEEINDG